MNINITTGIITGHTLGTSKYKESRFGCEITDEKEVGNWPDLNRVIPARNRTRQPTDTIVLNSSFLDPIVAASGKFLCKLLMDGDKGQIVVEFGDDIDDVSDCILMPARI